MADLFGDRISINPEMLVLAREADGLTQTELAARLEIAQGKLSRMEAQETGVDNAFLERLSAQLGRTPAFFTRPGRRHSGTGVTEIYHRKRAIMPKRQLARLHALIDTIRIHLEEILKSIDFESDYVFPLIDVDDPLESRDAVEIARHVRAMWRVPSGPVSNLTQLVEGAGGLVFVLDFETTLLDAVSRWYPGLPPMFFLNSCLPGDRYRYSLAHEVGHLVMHTHPNPEMEAQADAFAAEFLMPAVDIRTSLNNITLPQLARLKPYWKVSMASLLKRAGDLGKLTANQQRYMWSKFSALGFRKREPRELDITLEQPSLMQKVITTCETDLGWAADDFEHNLMTVESRLRDIYFKDQTALRVVR
jgi:Zn-dependent peptidase ImmA (M78 family)/transcriptional regulator with XRE-family HTH domain